MSKASTVMATGIVPPFSMLHFNVKYFVLKTFVVKTFVFKCLCRMLSNTGQTYRISIKLSFRRLQFVKASKTFFEIARIRTELFF